MNSELSKKEVQDKIDIFFKKENFSAEEVKKMKRLAMKYKIKLGDFRKLFCKDCLSKLKGKTRISKSHKIVECSVCGKINRSKI